MRDIFESPKLTTQATLDELASGRHVSLYAIGWQDHEKTKCPDCGEACYVTPLDRKLVNRQLFQFGVFTAFAHQCGQSPAMTELGMQPARTRFEADDLANAGWDHWDEYAAWRGRLDREAGL